MSDIERTFDYRTKHDPRSVQFFKVADNFAIDRPLKSRARRHYGPYLDQGSEGACVGFGTSNALAVTPKRRTDVTNDFARAIYREAQKIDEWPGEDYSGTSVLAGMKTAHSLGYIKSYYWATSLSQVQQAVIYLGPVVVGFNWYTGMFNTDANRFIHPTGDIAGGHCVAIVGLNLAREAFVIRNSWGKDWGKNGAAYLSFSDTEKLLIDGRGEAAVFRK